MRRRPHSQAAPPLSSGGVAAPRSSPRSVPSAPTAGRHGREAEKKDDFSLALSLDFEVHLHHASVCLSVCPSVCSSMCLSVCLPVCLCLSVSVCLCLYVCLSVCTSVCLSVCLSVCTSVCLSVQLNLTILTVTAKCQLVLFGAFTVATNHVCLYVCLSVSVCLSVCLSVCQLNLMD